MEYSQSNELYPQNRPSGMTTAAFILSIISIATFCCIYATIICSSLACILALLSRGGDAHLPKMSKVAIIISTVAIVLTIFVTAYSFISAISSYGSLEQLLNEYNYIYENLYDSSLYEDMSLFIHFRL